MSKRPLAFIAAGFVVALLWTPLVSNLFPLLPIATSRFLWRATQFFVGLFSALVLVLPIAIAMRPVRVGHGAILLVAFLVSLTFLHWAFGGTTTTLIEMFQLPDIWAFFWSVGLHFLAVVISQCRRTCLTHSFERTRRFMLLLSGDASTARRST